MATCKDCIHEKVCKNAYLFKVTPPNVCGFFKNKADVAEVKHGEWIQEWELEKGLEDNDEIPYIKCSLCGHIEWNIDKERNTTPNYCSKCGAKMDGGKEE